MPDDEQLIRDVINTWMSATGAGDVATVLQLMDEDAVFLVPGQPPMRGREAFAAGLEKALEKFQIQSSSEVQEIQVVGDWAYCWNQLRVSMKPKAEGSPVERSGYTLTIFRRNAAGNWVLFRDANLLGE
jgi:uncharacterized protein (TIGR02246 family)